MKISHYKSIFSVEFGEKEWRKNQSCETYQNKNICSDFSNQYQWDMGKSCGNYKKFRNKEEK